MCHLLPRPCWGAHTLNHLLWILGNQASDFLWILFLDSSSRLAARNRISVSLWYTFFCVCVCVLSLDVMWTVITVSGFSFYNAEEVLWATAATALVTLSLTLFALQTKVRIIEQISIVREYVPLALLTHSAPSSLWLSASCGPHLHGDPQLPVFLGTTLKKKEKGNRGK